jgi:hypothetical protein
MAVFWSVAPCKLVNRAVTQKTDIFVLTAARTSNITQFKKICPCVRRGILGPWVQRRKHSWPKERKKLKHLTPRDSVLKVSGTLWHWLLAYSENCHYNGEWVSRKIFWTCKAVFNTQPTKHQETSRISRTSPDVSVKSIICNSAWIKKSLLVINTEVDFKPVIFFLHFLSRAFPILS